MFQKINGAWKIAADDARLMVPRAPDESGPGPYYRLLTEGTIRNYDGVLVPTSREPRSLDLNRNFPVNWRTDGEQRLGRRNGSRRAHRRRP